MTTIQVVKFRKMGCAQSSPDTHDSRKKNNRDRGNYSVDKKNKRDRGSYGVGTIDTNDSAWKGDSHNSGGGGHHHHHHHHHHHNDRNDYNYGGNSGWQGYG